MALNTASTGPSPIALCLYSSLSIIKTKEAVCGPSVPQITSSDFIELYHLQHWFLHLKLMPINHHRKLLFCDQLML